VGTLDVDGLWPALSPHLDRAFETTRKIGNPDAKQMCEDGDAQLWAGVIWGEQGDVPAVLGSVVTEIREYTNGYRVLVVLAMGGVEFNRWDQMILKVVEDFAKSEGCDAMDLEGRKGWGRWFPDYKQTSWTYTKEF
jgi:hypothetical protein